MNEFLILLQAKLDEVKSKENINSDIVNKLQGNLKELEIATKLDPKAVQKLADDIGKLLNQRITISNIGLDTKSGAKAGQEYGKQFSQGVSREMSKSESAVQNFTNSLKNAGKSSSEIESIISKVKELVTQIDSLHFKESTNGVMNIDASGIDKLGNRIKIAQTLTQNLNTKLWNVSHTDTSIISAKELDRINKAFADYTAKLAQFKSTNSEILSGLSTPITDFENKLLGLKNGTSTIDEVVNSFKSLNTEASNITANFSRQLSPIDNAIRNLAKGEETVASLRAEIKGLHNAPKEINSELNKCSSLLSKVKQIESENGRTSEWSQAYKEWANSVDALKAKLTTLRKEQTNTASTQIFKIGDLKSNDIAYMSKVYNTIEKQMSEINKMANAKGWNIVDVSGVEQADGKIKQLTLTVKDAEGALKRLTMQREKLQGNGKAQFGLMQVGDVKVIETASQAQEKLAQSVAKANAKLSEQVNKIQLSMETGGYESKVESLIARTRQWTDANGNARISTTALSVALDNLGNASKALSNNNIVENQKALIAAEKELDTQIKKVTSSVRSMNADLAKDTAVASLHNRVQDFMSKNGKAVKYFGDELRKILNETARGAEVSKTKLAQLEQSFGNIGVAARNAGKLGKTFFQTLREGMSSFSYWTSSTFLVMKAIQSVKGGLGTVKALDTALVDLKKTTTMTNSELEDFYYSSNKVGKQMGVTTEEIINQAAAWSRLGFSSEAMATKMAKYSSMFSSISPGLDLEHATDGLVSTMKAYSIGLDNADEVVDGIMSKINIIGNSKALNNSDIVDFLTRSSSALASANNSIEESIAMGEAIVEITRDAAGAGQVMKTTSMRIRGYDEEVEAYTEELENLKGEIADLTKTAKTPGGISLFTDETKETYKSTYKILEEISTIWNDLTDKNQAQLLEVLAGKRNGQALAALISNFKSAQESMDLMANSAGNAEKEMSVIMDSLDFKLNRLSETGTSVAQNLFKRDDMKTVVDSLTSVMNVIDSLTSKLGLFGSIGLGAGIFAGWKNVGIAEIY